MLLQENKEEGLGDHFADDKDSRAQSPGDLYPVPGFYFEHIAANPEDAEAHSSDCAARCCGRT